MKLILITLLSSNLLWAAEPTSVSPAESEFRKNVEFWKKKVIDPSTIQAKLGKENPAWEYLFLLKLIAERTSKSGIPEDKALHDALSSKEFNSIGIGLIAKGDGAFEVRSPSELRDLLIVQGAARNLLATLSEAEKKSSQFSKDPWQFAAHLAGLGNGASRIQAFQASLTYARTLGLPPEASIAFSETVVGKEDPAQTLAEHRKKLIPFLEKDPSQAISYIQAANTAVEIPHEAVPFDTVDSEKWKVLHTRAIRRKEADRKAKDAAALAQSVDEEVKAIQALAAMRPTEKDLDGNVKQLLDQFSGPEKAAKRDHSILEARHSQFIGGMQEVQRQYAKLRDNQQRLARLQKTLGPKASLPAEVLKDPELIAARLWLYQILTQAGVPKKEAWETARLQTEGARQPLRQASHYALAYELATKKEPEGLGLAPDAAGKLASLIAPKTDEAISLLSDYLKAFHAAQETAGPVGKYLKLAAADKQLKLETPLAPLFVETLKAGDRAKAEKTWESRQKPLIAAMSTSSQKEGSSRSEKWKNEDFAFGVGSGATLVGVIAVALGERSRRARLKQKQTCSAYQQLAPRSQEPMSEDEMIETTERALGPSPQPRTAPKPTTPPPAPRYPTEEPKVPQGLLEDVMRSLNSEE